MSCCFLACAVGVANQKKNLHLPIALLPGSCVGEKEREPGTHCLGMCQVPLLTCIVLCYTYGLPAERLYCSRDIYSL